MKAGFAAQKQTLLPFSVWSCSRFSLITERKLQRDTILLNMSEALAGRRIRCLLFDLGDTLWYRGDQENWERLESESNQHAIHILRQLGNPSSLPQLDDLSLGQHLRQTFHQQVRTMIRRSPLLEPDVCQIIAEVLTTWGYTGVDKALSTQIFEAMRIRIPQSRPLFSDALSTLTELRQRGFLLGVVTNRLWGGPPFYEDLKAMGLLEFFEPRHIAISGDLQVRKPNAQIFDYALQALSISPAETAMIGDSLSADIVGAQRLGIYAIWKPKTWQRTWALTHAPSSPLATNEANFQPSQDTFPGSDTADTQIEEHKQVLHTLPNGAHVTDDDYILARAAGGRDYLEQFQRGEIRPDTIIDQLSELLQLFPEVAKS